MEESRLVRLEEMSGLQLDREERRRLGADLRAIDAFVRHWLDQADGHEKQAPIPAEDHLAPDSPRHPLYADFDPDLLTRSAPGWSPPFFRVPAVSTREEDEPR